jgi:hypothetical protein
MAWPWQQPYFVPRTVFGGGIASGIYNGAEYLGNKVGGWGYNYMKAPRGEVRGDLYSTHTKNLMRNQPGWTKVQQYNPFGLNSKSKGKPPQEPLPALQPPGGGGRDFAAARGDLERYSQMASDAMKNYRAFTPQQFKGPFSLGKLDVGKFSSDNPKWMNQAQTYATQQMNEEIAAQCLSQAQYRDQLQSALADIALQQRGDIGGLRGEADAAWARIQNMGANTGLGFGPMAQRNLMTSSSGYLGKEAQLRQQYANEMAGQRMGYSTNIADTIRQMALARSGRQANAINYLYQNILPTEQGIWEGNANAAINAYGANASYLNDLASQWYNYQGLRRDSSQQSLDRARYLADIYGNTGSSLGSLYGNYWAT